MFLLILIVPAFAIGYMTGWLLCESHLKKFRGYLIGQITDFEQYPFALTSEQVACLYRKEG